MKSLRFICDPKRPGLDTPILADRWEGTEKALLFCNLLLTQMSVGVGADAGGADPV